MHHASFATFSRSQHTCMPVSPHAAVSFPESFLCCVLCLLCQGIHVIRCCRACKPRGHPWQLEHTGRSGRRSVQAQVRPPQPFELSLYATFVSYTHGCEPVMHNLPESCKGTACSIAGQEERRWQEKASWESHGSAKTSRTLSADRSYHA